MGSVVAAAENRGRPANRADYFGGGFVKVESCCGAIAAVESSGRPANKAVSFGGLLELTQSVAPFPPLLCV